MDDAFQWNDSYSVMIAAMDAQHKKLFEILGELDTAVRSGHGKDVTGGLLFRWIDWEIQHFAAEEELMKKHGYPSLAQHQTENKALISRALSFKKGFDAGTADFTPCLMTLVQPWLTNHIQTVDRKYSAFLNSLGVY